MAVFWGLFFSLSGYCSPRISFLIFYFNLLLVLVKFTGSALSLAAIWEYENMRSKALQFRQRAAGWIQRQHVKKVKSFDLELYL